MIKERIRYARKITNLTQKQLGERAGIAEPTIRKYELGLLNPKFETIIKIADAFNLPVSFFTGQQPFVDIELLKKAKAVVLHSFEVLTPFCLNDSINSITEFEYYKMISDLVERIEFSSDSNVNIYYKATTNNEIPKKDVVEYQSAKISLDLTDKHIVLIKWFDMLNELGQEKAIERIDELTKIEEYTKKE